ncbi:MAG: hypothetical protein FWG92_01620 [Leptospirales bacterium]|nr:hypothetical protein [Leptospirales bacterium]
MALQLAQKESLRFGYFTDIKKVNPIKKIIPAVFILLFSGILFAEDYQYQYFAEEPKYMPFSDYIPKVREHWYTVPHYVEDFYRLYGMKLYYNENSLRMNIVRLKKALLCNFRHPSEALVKVESYDEHLKYRRLMFMRINILIMRSYLKIAARYDLKSIRYHSESFAKEINESFDIAEKLYKEAIPYWLAAKKYAEDASTIKIITKLSNIESERYSIMRNELDYGKIIDDHLRRLDNKRAQLAPWLAGQQ